MSSDARDILKAKLKTKGFDLRDDNSIYQGDELIAQDVHITVDDIDCIAFDFNLIASDVDLGMPIKSVTMH